MRIIRLILVATPILGAFAGCIYVHIYQSKPERETTAKIYQTKPERETATKKSRDELYKEAFDAYR